MKPISFLLLTTLLLLSCNSNTIPKKPEGLLSEDKMVALLYDSYLAKAAKSETNTNGDRNINYHALLYQKHQTDSVSFHESLKYYSYNIKQNEEILKQVKAKIDNEIKYYQTKMDSIMNQEHH